MARTPLNMLDRGHRYTTRGCCETSKGHHLYTFLLTSLPSFLAPQTTAKIVDSCCKVREVCYLGSVQLKLKIPDHFLLVAQLLLQLCLQLVELLLLLRVLHNGQQLMY